MKRIASVFLCLILLLAFAACDTGSNESAPATSQGEVSEVSEGPVRYEAEIPEGFSFGGETVTILTSVVKWEDAELFDFGGVDEELVQNVINDAALRRKQYVEETLDCVIAERCVDRWYSEAVTVIPNEINSGTASFDLVSAAVQEASAIVNQSVFYDLYSLENLHDLSEPWWDAGFIDAAEIKGKLFFVTGDISFRNRESLSCIHFNKKLVQDLGLEDQYTIVREKRWTLDVIKTYAKSFSGDVNNDGILNYEDKCGMVCGLDNIWAMFYGTGEKMVSRQADGGFAVTLDNERAITVADAIVELMKDHESSCVADDYWSAVVWPASPGELTNKMFIENRSIYSSATLGNTTQLREMSVDFGILPMPLYDENQEEYYSLMNPWAGAAFSVPISLTDEEAENSAVLMEMLGAEGKNTLIPAYCDILLKGQLTRDDESLEMLDIIIASAGCDSGHIHNWGEAGYKVLHATVNAGNGTYVSIVQSQKTVIETAIQKTLSDFEDMQ